MSGLRRDYFWDSPEAAWLRGPLNEVHARAVELSQRAAIKNMAMQQARTHKIPYGQAYGDFKRSIRLPGDIKDRDIPAVDGYGDPYKNPAAPNDMESAKVSARETMMLEAIAKERESAAATERSRATFTKAHSGPSLMERMREYLGRGAGGARTLEDVMFGIADMCRVMHGGAPAPPPPEL